MNLPGTGKFAGNPDGLSICQLRTLPVTWSMYVAYQGELLHSEGHDPDNLAFGYLQHPKIKPMYGISGPPDFQKARRKWNEDVIAHLRWLKSITVQIPAGNLKECYLSPFDGQIK